MPRHNGTSTFGLFKGVTPIDLHSQLLEQIASQVIAPSLSTMHLIRTFLSLLALVSSVVEGRSATGQRVLVIVEHAINRADYSHFWDSLQGELHSPSDDMIIS
jgi:hypothetical protein